MSWDDNVRIETPEQIEVELELAGPGSRFLATWVDWFFKWVVVIFISLIGALVGALATGKSADDWSTRALYIALGILSAVAFAFFFGYDIYFEGFGNGQTPGKRLVGIRVVREGGGPIDATAACIRNLVGLADFLPLLYILGGLVIMLNKRGQRLGDMAAGTVVIRERHEEAPADVDGEVQRMSSTEFAFEREQLERCAPGDLHVLRTFFARRRMLERRARLDLGFKLCDIYLQKTGYRPEFRLDHPADVRSFLASLYRDLQSQRRDA